MKCDICGGQYREKLVSRSYRSHGRTAVVDDIPALMCDRCSDILLTEATVQTTQELLQKEPKDTAPSYRFPRKTRVASET